MFARLAALMVLLACQSVWAADFPKGFTVPADFRENAAQRRYSQFDSTEFSFPSGPDGRGGMTRQKVEGHVWRVMLSAVTLPYNAGDPVVAAIALGFEKDGWTILRRQGAFVARKAMTTGDLWVSGSGNGGSFPLQLAEIAAPPRPLVLPPPDKTAETVADDRDLPYALPMGGAKLKRTDRAPVSFATSAPGAKERTFATATLTKVYQQPEDISSYEFVAVYRKALEGNGWEIIHTAVGSDGVVIAHYAKDGRDIWLYARAQGSLQQVSVADIGAETQAARLRQELNAHGHIALYGIYFDTDSPVPRPESETTLQQVLALLKSDAALRLEVQGHTDDTGAAEHNAGLSEARAASVRRWLLERGIAADRLTSHGYAATKPVADNRSPEGRAKNRRVEIARI